MPIIANVIIGKIITVAHYLDHREFFAPTFAKGIQSGDETQMRGLRGREVISGRKLTKNWRKLVSIRGTVSLINSVRRGTSRITATAAKAVGLRSPAKSGLNLIYTTHFLARPAEILSICGRRETHEGVVTPGERRQISAASLSPFHLSQPDVASCDGRKASMILSRRSRSTLIPPRSNYGGNEGWTIAQRDGGLINCSTEKGRHRMTCYGSLKVDGR